MNEILLSADGSRSLRPRNPSPGDPEVTPYRGLALATERVPARQVQAELTGLDREASGATRTPAPGPGTSCTEISG